MRRLLESARSIPLLFAVLTLLGYGFFAASAGFHWDDWGFAWAAHFLGPAQFMHSFSGFRPFLGPIFFLTTSLIPPVPLYWQLFALLIRFLIGLCTYWALKSIWPNRERLALTTGLFMLAFPAYSQHGVALTHINQELIPFIAYLLSFGISARAARSRNTRLLLLALFLQFWGLFPTEYFLGLEPLRFLFFWSMLEEADFPMRLRRAFILWLPYLFLWLADGAWLAFLYSSDAYVSYGIQSGAQANLWALPGALLDAVLKTALIAWGQVLFLAGSLLPSPTSLLTFGLVLLSLALLALYLPRLALTADERRGTAFLCLTGLAGIMLGRLPSFAAGLPLTLQSVFDRFTISMALGACLFLAALAQLLAERDRRLGWLAVSLLVALGVGQQFYNANIFRRDRARQQEIYWQMAWRAPALQPGTLILTSVIPNMPLETDLSFTAAVNWIYAPDYQGGDLPYALLYSEARLGGGVLPAMQPHTAVTLPFRTVSFPGSTDAAVVMLIPERGCLRVLDPALQDQVTYEKESKYLTEAVPLSDPSRIQVDAVPRLPPAPPFDREPAHTWCFYYEKSELARQKGDWEQILHLEEEARSLGYVPEEALEWLPFIEAHARLGDIQSAARLSREAIKAQARARKGVCAVWERVQQAAPSQSTAASEMLEEFECTP
ncbi:MAG: hypothetical protein ACM3QS_13645 [Bacteroidota bacterium]